MKDKPVEWTIEGYRGKKPCMPVKAPKPPRDRRYRKAPSSGECQDCIGMYSQTGECFCDKVTKE